MSRLRLARAVSLLIAAGAPCASASPTLSTLKSFCSETDCADGSYGTSGLTMDGSGILYGTTGNGGTTDHGVVFELVPNAGKTSWTYSVIHDFCIREVHCRDGGGPAGTLVLGTDGSLYGVTQQGGHTLGMVYRLTPNPDRTIWTETKLYRFCSKRKCKDGSDPKAGLTYAGAASGLPYDGASPLYGTTYQGGRGSAGTVYEISFAKGAPVFTQLYAFCSSGNCNDGLAPATPLSFDATGNLLGTAAGGGAHTHGVVFRLAPQGDGTWQEDVLYDFCRQSNCTDGFSPQSGVILDAAGNLYGTTVIGGTAGKGVLYKLVPSSGGGSQLTVLYNFCVDAKCTDGFHPQGNLVMNASGTLFGTTYGGGSHSLDKGGTIYQFDGTTHSVLYSFCSVHHCADGIAPQAGPIMDGSGNFYGATQFGGANNAGTVYEFKP